MNTNDSTTSTVLKVLTLGAALVAFLVVGMNVVHLGYIAWAPVADHAAQLHQATPPILPYLLDALRTVPFTEPKTVAALLTGLAASVLFVLVLAGPRIASAGRNLVWSAQYERERTIAARACASIYLADSGLAVR